MTPHPAPATSSTQTASAPAAQAAPTSAVPASSDLLDLPPPEPPTPEPPPVGPDLRLLPPALLAWTVTWWATAQHSTVVLWSAAALALLALAALTLALLRIPGVAAWPVVVSGVLVVAVGAGALGITGVRLRAREHDPLTRAAAQEQTARFTGRVMTDPRRIVSLGPRSGEPRWLVELHVSRLTIRRRTASSSGVLVVIAGPAWSRLVAGSHVEASARLLVSEPADPSWAVAFPRGAPRLIDHGTWIWRTAEHLRTGLRQACRGLPSDARGLLPALVVGDTSRLDPGLESDLKAAGLTHLTAVSGGNLAVIAAMATMLIAAGGGGTRLRVGGTVLIIIGFVVLARPEPSVLRAAVMGGLALVGLMLARPGAGLPVLGATSIGLLFADPWLSRSFGFALSVLATGGLLLLVPAWVARARRIPGPLVLAVGVPLAAQLVTAPVTVLLNPVVSLVAVPANLLVAVAVAPATVAGVAAAALSTVWPFGAHLAALTGGAATVWIAFVAHRAAGVPLGSVPWPSGLTGAVLLAGVTGAGIVLGRRRRWPLLAALLLVVALGLVVPHWVQRLPIGPGRPPSDWVVLQCDVGQGSATLLRSGPARAVMIDTGPDPGLAERCLRSAGVRRLDLVLLTHFHADHAGGITGVLPGRGSPPVLVSPFAEPDDEVRRVTAAVAATGRRPIPVTAPLAGTAGTGADEVRWLTIPPPRSALSAANRAGDNPEGTEVNNASVVLLAQLHGLRVLALGDVEPESQRPLLRTLQGLRAGPVDVVVVAHHGSARQLPQLYAYLRPRAALIGVGLGNDYGHPAASALAMLRALGTVTLRTDTQGWLAVSGTPARLRVATHR